MIYRDSTGRFQVSLSRDDVNMKFIVAIVDNTTMKLTESEFPMDSPLIAKTSLDEYIWSSVEAIIEDEVIKDQKE